MYNLLLNAENIKKIEGKHVSLAVFGNFDDFIVFFTHKNHDLGFSVR